MFASHSSAGVALAWKNLRPPCSSFPYEPPPLLLGWIVACFDSLLPRRPRSQQVSRSPAPAVSRLTSCLLKKGRLSSSLSLFVIVASERSALVLPRLNCCFSQFLAPASLQCTPSTLVDSFSTRLSSKALSFGVRRFRTNSLLLLVDCWITSSLLSLVSRSFPTKNNDNKKLS